MRRRLLDRVLAGAGTFAAVPLALFALAPACGSAHAAPGGPADPDTAMPAGVDPYIYRDTGARADPVNLVFRASDTDTVVAALTQVLGWPAVEGSSMTFHDAGGNRPTARQFGVNLGGGSRLHLRVEAVTAADGQSYVLAAAHRDDAVACGHVGRAFDTTRDLVGRAFANAGYRVATIDAANTASGQHCDGSQTPGDGRVAVISRGGP